METKNYRFAPVTEYTLPEFEDEDQKIKYEEYDEEEVRKYYGQDIYELTTEIFAQLMYDYPKGFKTETIIGQNLFYPKLIEDRDSAISFEEFKCNLYTTYESSSSYISDGYGFRTFADGPRMVVGSGSDSIYVYLKKVEVEDNTIERTETIKLLSSMLHHSYPHEHEKSLSMTILDCLENGALWNLSTRLNIKFSLLDYILKEYYEKKEEQLQVVKYLLEKGCIYNIKYDCNKLIN
jgi:hypothetical protein